MLDDDALVGMNNVKILQTAIGNFTSIMVLFDIMDGSCQRKPKSDLSLI